VLLKLLSFAAEIAFGKLIWFLIHFGESDFFCLDCVEPSFFASPCLWGSRLFIFLSFYFFSSNKFVRCGVVNALIKGEIEMPVC
jgi:hypothetical protein